MTIPASFPAHWRTAIATGDASGFRTRSELLAFFEAMDDPATNPWDVLDWTERGNLQGLMNEYPRINGEACAKVAARLRATDEAARATKRPAFLGGSASSPASKATPLAAAGPDRDPWAKAISRHNAERHL